MLAAQITYRQLAREAGLTTEQAKRCACASTSARESVLTCGDHLCSHRQMQLYLENADAKTRGVDATYLVSGAPLKSGASGTDATKMDVDEPSISTAATSSSSSQMPDWCVKLVKCQELQSACCSLSPFVRGLGSEQRPQLLSRRLSLTRSSRTCIRSRTRL